MSDVERDGKARRERAHTVALWRYTLIAAAMDQTLTGRESGRLVRELARTGASGAVRRPGDGCRARRWTAGSAPAGGVGSMRCIPATRRVEPRTDAAVLDLAVSIKKENPRRTATQVRRILVELSDPHGWCRPNALCSDCSRPAGSTSARTGGRRRHTGPIRGRADQ